MWFKRLSTSIFFMIQPTWAPDKQRKCFLIRFRRDIRIFLKLSNFAMFIIPRRQAPWHSSHNRVKLHTGESEYKISLVSGCFLRDNREKSFKWGRWTHLTWKKRFVSNFVIECLGEIKTELQNNWACLSDGFESWKKWSLKISWHTPFNLQQLILDSLVASHILS